MRKLSAMKITLINNLYAPYERGGAEISVETLAVSLASKGVDTSIITLHDAPDVIREDRGGVSIWRVPVRNLYWPFGSSRPGHLRRLAWHLRDINNRRAGKDVFDLLKIISPDVVHTNNLAGFSVSAWESATKLGIPVAHTARDYYLLHPNSTLFRNGASQSEKTLSARTWSMQKRRSSSLVSHFIGISKYVVDVHSRNGYFQNATKEVIYNSISMPAAEARTRHVRRDCVTFGYIGRLDPSKGVELAIQAMQTHSNARLIVAGSGEEEYVAALKQAAPSNVSFVGRQVPAEFLQQIDFLVVPSLWNEPLGRVILESYSQAVPVVAARIGGIVDIVNDGVTGTLFSTLSTEPTNSIAAAMYAISQLDYATLSKNSLLKSREFSTDLISCAYLRSFERLSSTLQT